MFLIIQMVSARNACMRCTLLLLNREIEMSSNDTDRAWELMKDIGFCMLCTKQSEDIRARPMSAHVVKDENAIYFLTDVRGHKDDEIESRPDVTLAFANPSGQKYVSLIGAANVSNDRQKIHELWSTPAKAWWKDENDPNIRVLTINPKSAEFWDSPGTVISYVKMFAAAMSDTRPEIGNNAKVRM